MMRGPSRGDDSGAALILALIMITVVALVLTTVLTFADTSLRATVNLRSQASTSYEAQGAIQAAINDIRNSTYHASNGQNCFGTSNTLTLPGFSGTDSTAVGCSADPTKVLIHCTSPANCNRPGAAILTLGPGGEDGINIRQNTAGVTRVHGTVFSNSNIDVVNGALDTNAAVYARGLCQGTVQAGQGPYCLYGLTPNSVGNDPGYATASGSVPTYQPLPPCTTPNSTVVFQPGYYDDAAGLTDMMSGNSACKHSVWWFKPGTYYFDFHNDSANILNNPDPLLTSQKDQWLVDDGYLVAGTPTNAAGSVISSPTVPANIPGACDSPIDDANAKGVQFIFGGDSQFQLGQKGRAEICGTYSASRPPVAVYGTSSGSETKTSLTGSNAVKLTSVVSAPSFTNATTANLAATDGTYASFRRTGNGNNNASATLTVGGFTPSTAIPAGSILQSATLRVVHRHSTPATSDTLSASVAAGGAFLPATSLPGIPGGALFQTSSVVLDASRNGALAAAVHNGFGGATIALTVTPSGNGDTEDIDSIQLDLQYTAPAYRAPFGCVTGFPYTGNGNSALVCAQILVTNGSGGVFYIQGTTYVPRTVVDVTLNNAAEQVFRFGIIARSVWMRETGSFTYNGPIVEVPDDSPGFAFSVYLSAYVCPGASTCTATGTPQVRAKVAFIDTDPASPVAGKRQVAVLSWSGPG